MATGPSIGVDLPCIRCRYSLRGMDARGLCPECALPIPESLDPFRLVLADRRWLASAVRATLLLLAGPPAYLVLVFAVLFLSAFQNLVDPPILLPTALGVMAPVVLLLLVTLATRPDRLAGPTAHVGRWLAIGASLVMIAVCSTAPLWLFVRSPPLPGPVVPIVAIAGCLTVAAGMALYWHTLARRERDRPLTRATATLLAWVPIVATLVASLLLIELSEGARRFLPAGFDDSLASVTALTVLAGLLLCGGTNWLACRLLRRCRHRAIDPELLPTAIAPLSPGA